LEKRSNSQKKGAEVYLDLKITFSTGEILYIEHLGSNSKEYNRKKNLANVAYLADNKAVLFTYQDTGVLKYHRELNSHIKHNNPLLDLDSIRPLFNIMHRIAVLGNLPHHLALSGAKQNPDICWVDETEANLFLSIFNVGENGVILGNHDFFTFL